MLATELERLAAAVSLTGAGMDDIGEFGSAAFDYHAAHPELGRLLQWEGLQEGPPADAIGRTEHYREKAERFAAAQRDGVLDPGLDPALLVFALIALAASWQTVPQLAEMITRRRTGRPPGTCSTSPIRRRSSSQRRRVADRRFSQRWAAPA